MAKVRAASSSVTDNKGILKNMLDNLIKGNSNQAQVNFHQYLQGKMQQTLKPRSK